jgi:chemotaxis protein MotB
MNDDPASVKTEIVIVRRRNSDDGAAGKGGAWKIAYADFVTAMMAFFLVMWLINASNEATRAQVASYFNPIKLTDSSTGSRGLKEKKENKTTQAGETDEVPAATSPGTAEQHREEQLMTEPQEVLEKLATSRLATAGAGHGIVVEEPSSIGPETSAPGVGDPFDPRSWEKVPEQPPQNSEHSITSEKSTDQQPLEKQETPDVATFPEPAVHNRNIVPDAEKAVRLAQDTLASETEKPAVEPLAKVNEASKASEIAAEIAVKLGTGLDDLPASVDVKVTDEGTLISLTDKHAFGMFKSGSAEPDPQVIELVGAIAEVLAAREGYIVVRGHTDSRPFRNRKYDNWQLSTARAHLAQYMLIRGGLQEARIRRVEGVADREPRVPENPQAPENRRIEILLGHEAQ